MTSGYYIKIENLFWTGRFWRGAPVLTEKATRATRFSLREVAEETLEDLQGIDPRAVLVLHLANGEKEKI